MTPPTLSFTSTQNIFSGSTATFSFSGSDNMSISAADCQLDGTGGTWGACTTATISIGNTIMAGSYTLSSLSDGIHNLYARARDSAGNIGVSMSYGFTVDQISPVVTLSGSSPMSLVTGGVFSDPGATWADTIDGTGTILSATSGSVNMSATGSYTLTYAKTDRAGNIGSTTRTVMVVSAPQTGGPGPISYIPINGVCGTASGQTFVNIPTANLCTSGNTGSVTDGGVGANYSWSCGGIHTGSTTMSCRASHTNTTQTRKNQICSGNTANNSSLNTPDPATQIVFTQTSIDGGITWLPTSKNWTHTTTPIECGFTCDAGYSYTGATNSCTLNGNSISISYPDSTFSMIPINTSNPRFSGSGGTGITQVVIYKSGGIFLGSGRVSSGSYNVPSLLSLSDGIHTVMVTGKDTLGNSGSTATRTFAIDTIPPAAPTLSSTHIFTSMTPILSGSGEIGTTLEIRSGGTGGTLFCGTTISQSGSWSCDFSTFLSDPLCDISGFELHCDLRPSLSVGTSTLVFLARDTAGNIGSTARSITVLPPGAYISTGTTLSGITLSATGSRLLHSSGAYLLTGSVLSIRSGSILISGSGGSLTLTGNIDIRVGSGTWDTTLLGPTNVGRASREYLELSDTGVTSNLPQNNTTTNYTHKILDTFLMGGSGTVELALSGQLARIDLFVTGSRIGDTVRIFRSSDGQSWILNSPDTTCMITSANRCQFSTDHFSYFGFVETTQSQVSASSSPSGPGGGGSSYVTYTNTLTQMMIPAGLQYLAQYGGNSIPLDIFLGMRPLGGVATPSIAAINPISELNEEMSDMRCDLEKKVERSEFLFRDISRSQYRTEIEDLTEYWIVRNQEHYRPKDIMTKGDFLIFAVRAMRCHYSMDEFDAAKGRGYRTSEGVSRYIGLAEKFEWIGRGFRPEQTITRKEAVEIINKMLGGDGSSSYKTLAENLNIIDPGMDIRKFTYKTLSRGEGAEIVARAFLSE